MDFRFVPFMMPYAPAASDSTNNSCGIRHTATSAADRALRLHGAGQRQRRSHASRASSVRRGGAHGCTRDEANGVELRLLHVRVEAYDALHARQRQRDGPGVLLRRLASARRGHL
jgi:hypothetical protein